MNKEKELGALKRLLSGMPKPDPGRGFEERMLEATFARLDEEAAGPGQATLEEVGTEAALTGSAKSESEPEVRLLEEKNFVRELNNRERNAKQTKKLKVIAYSLMVAASLFIGIVYYPNLVQLATKDGAGFELAKSESDGAERFKGEDVGEEAKARSFAISESAAAPESVYHSEDREAMETVPESAYDGEDMALAPESKTNAPDKGTDLEDANTEARTFKAFSDNHTVMISLWILHLFRIL